MALDRCTDLSLKLVALGKRSGHEYLTPAMLHGMNITDPLTCLLCFLGDEHRDTFNPTQY